MGGIANFMCTIYHTCLMFTGENSENCYICRFEEICFHVKPEIFYDTFPAGFYLFKEHNRNPRTMFEICAKLFIKTSEQGQWHRLGLFFVIFEQISQIPLVFPLLNLSK